MRSFFVDFHRSCRLMGMVWMEAGLESDLLLYDDSRAFRAAAVIQSLLILLDLCDEGVPAAESGL